MAIVLLSEFTFASQFFSFNGVREKIYYTWRNLLSIMLLLKKWFQEMKLNNLVTCFSEGFQGNKC